MLLNATTNAITTFHAGSQLLLSLCVRVYVFVCMCVCVEQLLTNCLSALPSAFRLFIAHAHSHCITYVRVYEYECVWVYVCVCVYVCDTTFPNSWFQVVSAAVFNWMQFSYGITNVCLIAKWMASVLVENFHCCRITCQRKRQSGKENVNGKPSKCRTCNK